MIIHYIEAASCYECHGQPAELLLTDQEVARSYDQPDGTIEADPEMVEQLIKARAEVERLEHALWRPVRELEEERQLQYEAFQASKYGPPTPKNLVLRELAENRRAFWASFWSKWPSPSIDGGAIQYVKAAELDAVKVAAVVPVTEEHLI